MAARRALCVLVLSLVLAHAVGAASAQTLPGPGRTQLTLFLVDPGGGFRPGANGSIQIGINYQYSQGAAPQPAPTPDYAENTTPTRITLSAVAVPSWVESYAFVPPVVEARIPVERQATGGTVQVYANITLLVKPDAPALTREDLVVAAEAAANGNLQPSSGESPPLKIRVAPVGKLNVTAEPAVVLPGGRWTTVTYLVKNEGNSDVVARLNVTVKPENSEIEFPRSVTVPAGGTAPVEVRVRTPWTNAELGTLTLEAVPLVDGEEGPTAAWDVDVRGESAVPFVGLPLLVVVLGLVATMTRRR